MIRQPVLYLVAAYSPAQESIPLYPGEYTVGRDGKTDIPLPSMLVSRLQAKLIVDAKGVTVIDLQSTNGTRVGASKVRERRVSPGETIDFGKFPMIVSLTPQLPVDEQGKTNTDDPVIIPPNEPLTPAQNRVFLALLHGSGMTEKEIARKFNLTPNTIHRHIQAIYEKYGVRSKHELILKALGRPGVSPLGK